MKQLTIAERPLGPGWLRLRRYLDRCHWPAVAMLSLALWQPAQAQTDQGAPASRSLTEWLTRMHEASRHRAYTGTLVVNAGAALSASRIWHVCDGRQQMERVETLTGAPRSTFRHNTDVIAFSPEEGVAWKGKQDSLGVFPELLRTPDNSIPEFYRVREGGSERVAGHLADVVYIEPRDSLRYAYRVWSEKKTGLVVKLQTLDESGDVLEQVAFSELQLDAPVSMDRLKRLMNDTQGYRVQQRSVRKTAAEAQGWRLKEPVPGFRPMGCHTQESAATVQGTASAPMQWVFSDGLASVSVFVEAFDASRHGEEVVSVMGATHSLARRHGEHWVTVLGEVPVQTLRRFVAQLERIR